MQTANRLTRKDVFPEPGLPDGLSLLQEGQAMVRH